MYPALFNEHNKITSLVARDFFQEVALDWKKGSKVDIVMDIGCGSGNASTHWIDVCFPDIGRLIGIDIDPGMIDLARQHWNKKGKFEFHVADIMDRASLSEWEGRVSKVFSHFVLHRVSDQRRAFRNLFDLLEPSGEAALQTIVRSPFMHAVQDILQTPKWKPILEPTNMAFPESFLKNYDAEHFRKMFEEVGFKVTQCDITVIDYSYDSDDHCKNFLLSLRSIGEVSDDIREDYKRDLFERYMQHSWRDEQGRPKSNTTVLKAKLIKEKQQQDAGVGDN